MAKATPVAESVNDSVVEADDDSVFGDIPPEVLTVSATTEQNYKDSFNDQIMEVVQRTKLLESYVRDHMVLDKDYGVIPGMYGTPKTLFKPGAEKLNAVFKVAPHIEVVDKTMDTNGDFVSYDIKVKLISYAPETMGQVMGEGVGNANSREKAWSKKEAFHIANNIFKIAKKRALVDASLSTSLASGIFSQDLEDLDTNETSNSNSDSTAPLKSSGGTGKSSALVIDWGMQKGKKISEVSPKDLEYYMTKSAEGLDGPYGEKNKKFLMACFDDLDSRGITYDNNLAKKVRS